MGVLLLQFCAAAFAQEAKDNSWTWEQAYSLLQPAKLGLGRGTQEWRLQNRDKRTAWETLGSEGNAVRFTG